MLPPRLLPFLASLFLVFGAPRLAAAQDTLSVDLSSVVVRALSVSPEIAMHRAREDFAAARQRLARASRFAPDFTLTTAHAVIPGVTNPNGVPTGELYLDPDVRNDWDALGLFSRAEAEILQPIFTWGEISGSVRAAGYGAAVEAGDTDRKRQEVALRTAELYYSVLLARSLRRVAREATDVVDQALDEIDRLIEDGDPSVDEADLFQVRIAEQELLGRSAQAEQAVQTAEAALRRQLFLPDEVVLFPEATTIEPIDREAGSLDIHMDLGLTRRAELRQAQAGVAARRALVSVERSRLFPRVFVGARYRVSGTTADRFRQRSPFHSDPFVGSRLEAGVGLRLDLNFAQTRARVGQARAQAREVGYQAEAAAQLIRFEVESAYRGVLSARALLDTDTEALRISKEWLRTEQINFDLELGDTENLIKALEASLGLQARADESINRFNVAWLRLLAADGSLIQMLAPSAGTLVD